VLCGVKSGPSERRDDLVPGDPLVVPREHESAHQVRVRGLDPLERLEGGPEAHDAALAADAGHLNGLGLDGHEASLRQLDEAAAQDVEPVAPAELELLSRLVELAERRQKLG
jgi:hypothetical protein